MKRVLPTIIFISLFLTACGQRGNLYLPDQPPKHQKRSILA
ncbi:MAG: lipoprotein [Proteobacteria bacterium]|nr:lipoprotein [Pseudomonadota bacterium]